MCKQNSIIELFKAYIDKFSIQIIKLLYLEYFLYNRSVVFHKKKFLLFLQSYNPVRHDGIIVEVARGKATSIKIDLCYDLNSSPLTESLHV